MLMRWKKNSAGVEGYEQAYFRLHGPLTPENTVGHCRRLQFATVIVESIAIMNLMTLILCLKWIWWEMRSIGIESAQVRVAGTVAVDKGCCDGPAAIFKFCCI